MICVYKDSNRCKIEMQSAIGTKSLSEISLGKYRQSGINSGSRTVFLKCNVISAYFSSPQYVYTDHPIETIQDSKILYNLI